MWFASWAIISVSVFVLAFVMLVTVTGHGLVRPRRQHFQIEQLTESDRRFGHVALYAKQRGSKLTELRGIAS
jgi:hypothetical protein